MTRICGEKSPPVVASKSVFCAMLLVLLCFIGASHTLETNMTVTAEQVTIEDMSVEQMKSENDATILAAESMADSAAETMVDGSAESSATTLKPTERFRRLIPYMTFYFAQQGLAQRPRFQQYASPVQSHAIAPQYQGNLAVPAGYILRTKAQPIASGGSATGRVPQPFRLQPVQAPPSTTSRPPQQPRPFSLPYTDDPLLYTPQPSAPTPPPPLPPRPVRPAPPPPPLTTEQRTAALFKLLVLLQQSRRGPQDATLSPGSVSALSQTLALLQAAQSLPGEASGAVAKLLAHQFLLTPPAHAPPRSQSPLQPIPPRTPIAPLYGARTHALAPKGQLVRFQVTTLAPDVSPDLLYNTVSPTPVVKATPTPSPAAESPTPLVPVDDDLQNYLTPVRVSNVEVSPNGQDVNSPLQLTTLSPVTPKRPTPPPPPTPPAHPSPPEVLHPYDYAPKAPSAVAAPRFLGKVTFSQSFPDPEAEGGTPGRPGVDYPTLASIPPTNFNCKEQRYKGFFGDPETSCQVWHYCDLNGGQASFLCPNGTIFSQVALTCDWWFNVRCASTPQLYVLNERLYKYILPVMPSFPEDYSGPLVDQYLTLKFREQELKSKSKAAKGVKIVSTTPKPLPILPSAQPTQNTLQTIEDS